MKYFIISQNLVKSDLRLPKHAILRVNLAWHKNLNSVKSMLDKYKDREIFLDIPIGRKKPPNYDHNIDHIAQMANNCANVKYVAISNIEDPAAIRHYNKRFKANIVPKIETHKGVLRSDEIIQALNYVPQILMLDHEDLFTDLIHHGQEKHYLDIVKALVKTCKKHKAHLLRVKGIIFSNI